ncbi:hypothetical protein GA0061070_10852 [Kosakonia oryziphila]|uniref:Uncharacterized protein n=1 Tax=Kosakonia oryziphila TaxID=1005667 RepID=A0A1C4GM51_9ENTR|nr:hypothetical protein GA0061070_10852 [Kosakonia oryziphila]
MMSAPELEATVFIALFIVAIFSSCSVFRCCIIVQLLNILNQLFILLEPLEQAVGVAVKDRFLAVREVDKAILLHVIISNFFVNRKHQAQQVSVINSTAT